MGFLESCVIIASIITCVVIAVIAVLYFVVLKPPNSEMKPDPKREASIRALRKKCDEYKEIACAHPIPSDKTLPSNSSRILGGENVTEGQFPHMAYVDNLLKKLGYCGGTLISEYFVMTSADCVHDSKKENIKVKLGSVAVNDSNVGMWYNVDEIIVHENFIPDTAKQTFFHIALLKLATKVEFDWSKRPICLNTDYAILSDKKFTTCGWGFNKWTPYRGRMYVVDQYTDKEAQARCSSYFKPEILAIPHVICASNPFKYHGPSVGDQGGPLQIPLGFESACANTYEQVGIGIIDTSVLLLEDPLAAPAYILSLYMKVEEVPYWIVSKVWPEMLE